MSTAGLPGNPTVAPSRAAWIDAVCDRYEAAFKAGRAPRIEDDLAEAPGPDRPPLFRELLVLELELRQQPR